MGRGNRPVWIGTQACAMVVPDIRSVGLACKDKMVDE